MIETQIALPVFNQFNRLSDGAKLVNPFASLEPLHYPVVITSLVELVLVSPLLDVYEAELETIDCAAADHSQGLHWAVFIDILRPSTTFPDTAAP